VELEHVRRTSQRNRLTEVLRARAAAHKHSCLFNDVKQPGRANSSREWRAENRRCRCCSCPPLFSCFVSVFLPSPFFPFAARFAYAPPLMRGWRSADRRRVSADTRGLHSASKVRVNALTTLQTRHPAGCLPPSAEGGAPLGAPPWRFSAPDPRFRLRHFLRRSFSELLAARVVVPGGRCPCLPSLRLRAADARRHSPLRLSRRL
jgi:hypothetical protein